MSTLNEVKELYWDDIVYRFNKRKEIIFGVVCDDSGLQKGQIRVEWNNSHRRSVWKQNKVRLMSRSIVPTQTVRRLVNGTETRGYCRESKEFATVQIVGTDKIIERVPKERLNVVSRYDPNVIVCLDNKFGKLMSINKKIRMQSKCGSTVEIFSQNGFSSINLNVQDFWNGRYFDTFNNYNYPGQEVICTPNDLEQPQWIQISEVMKRSMQTRQRFTVKKVEPFDILVLWFNSENILLFEHIMNEDIPRLKVVKPVGEPYLGLNQRRLLKLNFSDVLLTKKDWIRKQSVLHQPKRHKVGNRLTSLVHRGPKLRCPSLLATYVKIHDESEEDWYTEEEEMSNYGSSSSTTSNTRLNAKDFPPKLRELVPGNTIAVEVLCIDSKVTIIWENGTIEEDIPTTLLYCAASLHGRDGHEFFPGEWVISDGRTEEYGAVQHVNNLERIATVKWFTHNEGDEKPQLVSTNEMSAYDLRKHPKYEFRPCSVVKPIRIENEKFGTVLDSYPEGYVIVQWINGLQESCWPKNLELVDATDYSDNEDIDEDNASDALPVSSAPPEDSLLNPLQLNKSVISSENDVFTILDAPHFGHRFYSRKFRPTDKQKFVETVEKQFAVLKESLPPGVWIRLYENRMDLLSVMIEGPKDTPYEDGLFLFDLQLSQDYPLSPPLCHYKSYSSEQLNPNLYIKGGVCISLLDTNVWSTDSTLLQLIVSIQGLILVAEPFFIECGFEVLKDFRQGYEYSRTYNELVILKVVESMKELALAPPEVFADEIGAYCATHVEKMCNRLERWWDDSDPLKPEFPLLPVSKGFKLSLTFALKSFKDVLKKTNSASNA